MQRRSYDFGLGSGHLIWLKSVIQSNTLKCWSYVFILDDRYELNLKAYIHHENFSNRHT
jgi:hypothetical protein